MVDHDFPIDMQFCVSTHLATPRQSLPEILQAAHAGQRKLGPRMIVPVVIVPRPGWKGPVVMFPEGARSNGSAILVLSSGPMDFFVVSGLELIAWFGIVMVKSC